MSNYETLSELAGNKASIRAAGKSLNVEQLDKLIDGLTEARDFVANEEAKANAELAQKNAKASEILQLINESGLTIEEVSDLTRRKVKSIKGKVEPKYRILVEGQVFEWTGRGLPPKKFKEYFEKTGKKKEDVLIN